MNCFFRPLTHKRRSLTPKKDRVLKRLIVQWSQMTTRPQSLKMDCPITTLEIRNLYLLVIEDRISILMKELVLHD